MPRDDPSQEPKLFTKAEVEDIIEKVGKEALRQVLAEHGIKSPYETPALDPNTPRAYTEEETREMLIKGFVDNARYWAMEPNGGTIEERCQGVAFSNLVLLDGCSSLPAANIYIMPGEAYIEDCREHGENWHDADVTGDIHLHDEFYPVMRKYYGEDAGGVQGDVLHPDQMREKLSEAIYQIADQAGKSSFDKLESCHNTARNIVALLDGENGNELPPFMLLPAPSREFDKRCVALGQPLWHTRMPINRKEPQYGVEDSLLDVYDAYRDRQTKSARDMFK